MSTTDIRLFLEATMNEDGSLGKAYKDLNMGDPNVRRAINYVGYAEDMEHVYKTPILNDQEVAAECNIGDMLYKQITWIQLWRAMKCRVPMMELLGADVDLHDLDDPITARLIAYFCIDDAGQQHPDWLIGSMEKAGVLHQLKVI